MAGVFLVDAGLLLLVIGAISLLRPLRPLGIRSRRAAALVSAAGLVSLASGFLLPAPLRRVTARQTRLDDLCPAYQFHERHEIRVHAPPERVFAAVRSVTAREIRFFRLLTWFRRPHLGPAPASILAPPADQPILEVALRSGFVLLAEEPGREIVFGTILGRRPAEPVKPEAFAKLERPGLSRAVMNFALQAEPDGWCHVTTETRVFSTDDSARRAFSAYWRVIYPGSALIRRMWLEAIRRRAERG